MPWSQQTGLLNTGFNRFKVHIGEENQKKKNPKTKERKSIANIATLMRMVH